MPKEIEGSFLNQTSKNQTSDITLGFMKKELSNRIAVLVRFNEADPLGIVWHGHYIRYFEDGREAFGKDHGLGYLDMYRQGFVTPVVSVQCDYKKSLRFGDSVIVETIYIPCEAAKIK